MGTLSKITRRTFLVGSATIAGGVAFGIYKAKAPLPNPLLDLNDGSISLNQYLKIDQGGVTIITPKAEMGQGVYTSLAAMVAEEMDLAWDQVKVDHGPPAQTYYNAAEVDEGLGLSSTDMSTKAELMRSLGAVLFKMLGMQMTGASTSVSDGFFRMRKAGAAARLALLQAAADQSGEPVENLNTNEGAVVLPDGTRLRYEDLAEAAANVEVTPDPQLKPEKEWRLLGKSIPRVDVLDKSIGAPVYGVDIEKPDMVYATVKINPRTSGDARKIDASKARQARGVIDVLKIKDGVAVIADNTWRAFKAADLLEIEWEDSPYRYSTDEIFTMTAAAISGKGNRVRNDGDVEEALQNSNAIEAEYRVPALSHSPLEPLNAVAQFKDGVLDIWTGVQIPLHLKKIAAKLAGIDAANVNVHVLMMGGSFGRRLELDYALQAVEIAMQTQGKPVKLTYTREEDMTHDFVRPPGVAKLSGAVSDGKVNALDIAVSHVSVSRSWGARIGLVAPGPDPMVVAGTFDQPLAIPNFRVSGYMPDDILPVASWRSVGASGNGFIMNGFLDELIHEAGADPLEERLRLVDDEPSRKVLERVGELANWGADTGPDRGRGLAFTISFGVPTAIIVDIQQTERGIRMDKIYAVADVGKIIDPDNVHAQLMGGVLWGLGHAIKGEITYEKGVTQQQNFHQYDGIRMYEVPEMELDILENQAKIRGIGEPGVPPGAPALANAIFDLTGKRIRELPLKNSVKFI